MSVIIAILILLFTPALMVFNRIILIRLKRSMFAYQYLMALFSALIAWILILISRPESSQILPLIPWQPESLRLESPQLLLDRFSWPFALALSTLLLAVILTAVTRVSAIQWRTWAGSLFISGFGLLAVLAGNPLTLLISWAALDIIEASLLVAQASDAKVRQKVILVLSARSAGIIALLLAMIASWSSGENLNFLSIQPQMTILLMIAAALRSGILPLHLPFVLETQFRRGQGTALRLISASTSFILIARTANAGINEQLAIYLLPVVAIAALYGAVAWATAHEELSGRPFWILGIISLSFSAAIRAQPEASIAWGIVGLLSGGLIFLASPRDRYLIPLLFLGTLNISSLPFTPLWAGWQAYGTLQAQSNLPGLLLGSVTNIVYLIAHILLILGYLRHSSHVVESETEMERWMWLLYIPGLVILIISQFIFGFFTLPELNTIPLAGWLSGLIVALITLVIWLRGRYLLYRLDFIPHYLWRLEALLHLSWLYRFLASVYGLISRIITMISNILEGEGGLLWTIIIVLLLFAFFRG